ncbi:MAG: hypothetical protein J0H88_09320 [Sphingomonadales bacterium]|nr:hypothetical protein [Sphingomonadales bacterium]
MLIFWGVFYIVLLLAIAVTVLRIGERESVIAILIVFMGSMMTIAAVFISQAKYKVFSGLVTSVDFVVLAAFLWQALRSRRYWTLCLPALQLITCFTHIVKYVAPEFLPRVYIAGQGIWTYPMLALIVGAALWARADRKARAGEVQGERSR